MTRLSETETWLALAREDQAAAVAGVDAEQLAAMGPESVMTGPAPCCGYPEADPEAGHDAARYCGRAWTALISEGPTADAVQSYLAPGPEPRYDTPQAQAEAEPEAGDRRPGSPTGRQAHCKVPPTPPWVSGIRWRRMTSVRIPATARRPRGPAGMPVSPPATPLSVTPTSCLSTRPQLACTASSGRRRRRPPWKRPKTRRPDHDHLHRPGRGLG